MKKYCNVYSEYYGVAVDTFDYKTGLILRAVMEQYDYGRKLAMKNNVTQFVRAYTDDINNTYHCLRMINQDSMKNGIIFCSFQCTKPLIFGPKHEVEKREIIECPMDKPEGKGEYYDLDKDPWNFNNLWDTLEPDTIRQYLNMIEKFHHCKGQYQCNSLRFGNLNAHTDGKTLVKRQSNHTFSILTNNYNFLRLSQQSKSGIGGILHG